MNDRAFSFLRVNEREGKPRMRGLTEIRGPYYTPMGKRYLEDEPPPFLWSSESLGY